MAENGPDPGGGDPNEDWKYVTSNSRIVILPDPRITSLLSQCEDDQSSTGTSDHVHGEGLEDLEYEYEPGISLHHMEFARSDLNTSSIQQQNDQQPLLHSSNGQLTSIQPNTSNSLHHSRCIHCGVDYESDLQLAAELGKTLLERNKDLEGTLKEHQAIIEDQSQEIEYLTKQTSALREVNDSRVKIYEQLEVSISELECTNKKLIEENQCDKSKIKSLCENVEKLETRCEELQRLLDEARSMLEKHHQLQKRRREKRKSSQQRHPNNSEEDEEDVEEATKHPKKEEEDSAKKDFSDSESSSRIGSISRTTQESGYSSGSVEKLDHYSDSEMSSPDREHAAKASLISLEDEIHLVDRLRVDKLEIEERLHEMEKVVISLQKENKRLQIMFASQCSQDSYKSVDDEVQDVQDVRRGKMCRKCLKDVDATPANLIGTAFQMMGETANHELQKVIAKWQNDELRLRSRNSWLDLGLLAVCFFALVISLVSSMVQLCCK